MPDHPNGTGGEYQPREQDHLFEPMIAALGERRAPAPPRTRRGCGLWIAALLAPLAGPAGLGLLLARPAPARPATGSPAGGLPGAAPPEVAPPQPAAARAARASGQPLATWLERRVP